MNLPNLACVALRNLTVALRNLVAFVWFAELLFCHDQNSITICESIIFLMLLSLCFIELCVYFVTMATPLMLIIIRTAIPVHPPAYNL